MGVGLVGREPDGAEAGKGQTRSGGVVSTTNAVDNGNQSRLIWQVVLGIVVLEAVCVAHIGRGQHGLRTERVLYAEAPLIAGRLFVSASVQAGDIGWVNRKDSLIARRQRNRRIIELDWGRRVDLQAERDVRAGVVHVIALNALIHHAETAADNGLAGAAQVVGKTDTRTEVRPVVVDQALRYAVLARDANAVQVELLSDDGIRAGAKVYRSEDFG